MKRLKDIPEEISIHSPLTGRDRHQAWKILNDVDFNPLSPHGERPIDQYHQTTNLKFQSTLPSRGETFKNFCIS